MGPYMVSLGVCSPCFKPKAPLSNPPKLVS
jgi:hypothetical protein